MPRGNPRHQHQRHQRTRDAGQLADPLPAKPEDAGSGATRGMHQQAQSEWQSCGATRKLMRRMRRRMRDSGQLENPSPARPEDAEAGATRGTHRQAQLEEQSCGATRSLCARCAEGCEIRGNSKIGRRQSLKMQDAGQLATSSGGATGRAGPQGSSAGRAEGCENRGNLNLHRGRSLRDAVSGATRRLSARLNGLMHGPGNL